MQLLEKNLRKLNETMPRVVDDALRHLLPHAALQKIERERDRKKKYICYRNPLHWSLQRLGEAFDSFLFRRESEGTPLKHNIA
jgi:hypothetical protein